MYNPGGEFTYEITDYPCPECSWSLIRVVDSNMLCCNNEECAKSQENEPFFLIEPTED